MNQRTYELGRRKFLASAAAAVAAPYVIPSGVLAADGRPGANDRLTLAHIGVGGMGGRAPGQLAGLPQHGDGQHRGRLRGRQQSAGRGRQEGRRGLPDLCATTANCSNGKDIDAVVIASPDHWHAVQTVHACQAGKHVYVEKPASCTVADGRAMVEAARKHNRVVQVGSQARSAEPAHQVCTYLRNGMLGKVHQGHLLAHARILPAARRRRRRRLPELDWDHWLGPLSWRPYIPGPIIPGSSAGSWNRAAA